MQIIYMITEDQMETLRNYFDPEKELDTIQEYEVCEWLDELIDNLVIGTY